NSFAQVLIDKKDPIIFHGCAYIVLHVGPAFALINIDIIVMELLVDNTLNIKVLFLVGLQNVSEVLKEFEGGRSRGLIAASENYENAKTKEHFDTKHAPLIVQEAANRGLICRAVTYDEADTVVLAPPLIINKEQIEEMLSILKEAIVAVTQK